jgi:hypothetical protein
VAGTELTHGQERMRARFEAMIGLAAPFLDLVLAVGERVSKIADPEDADFYPVRRGAEGSFLGNVSGRGDRGRSIGGRPHVS